VQEFMHLQALSLSTDRASKHRLYTLRPESVATVMRSCRVTLRTVIGCRARSLARHDSSAVWRDTHILTMFRSLAMHCTNWTVWTAAVTPPSHYILQRLSLDISGTFTIIERLLVFLASCWFKKRRELFYHWSVVPVIMATEKLLVQLDSTISLARHVCATTFALAAILMLHCGRFQQVL
jgi:hypothetical protein